MSSSSRRVSRRMLLTSLLLVLAVPIGGAANAYWSGSGSGAGSGTTGTALALTLSPGTPSADLYPGGEANVVLTVSNPNAYPVYIGSLALDTGQGIGGFFVDAGHSGCDVSTPTLPALPTLGFTTDTTGWTVLANDTLSVTLTNALTMGEGATNACQGASYKVYLAAGA